MENESNSNEKKIELEGRIALVFYRGGLDNMASAMGPWKMGRRPRTDYGTKWTELMDALPEYSDDKGAERIRIKVEITSA